MSIETIDQFTEDEQREMISHFLKKKESENMEENLEDRWEIRDGNRLIFNFENVGDTIEGVLIGARPSGRFENTCYDIDNDDGNFTVFGTAVLNNRLSEKDVGKTVRIKYKGESTSKSGQNYKDFEVAIKKGD